MNPGSWVPELPLPSKPKVWGEGFAGLLLQNLVSSDEETEASREEGTCHSACKLQT